MAKFVTLLVVLASLVITNCQHNYRGRDPYGSGYYYEEPAQDQYRASQFYPGADFRALPVAESEPQIRPLQLGIPKGFKEMMEPMKKQAEEAGDKMQKSMEDMSEAMEKRMKEMTSTKKPPKKKGSEEEKDSSSEEEPTTKNPDSSSAKPEADSKEVVPEPKRIEYPSPDFVDIQNHPARFYFDFYE